MVLVGLTFEPVSLDVHNDCFDEEQDILNTDEKSIKRQRLTAWCGMREMCSNTKMTIA